MANSAPGNRARKTEVRVDDDSEPGADTVAALGEFGLIHKITAARSQPPTTLLGPGDDAALVTAADGRVVVTTDILVEGVHFRFDWSSPAQIGRKAAAVNLADLAAMGATPTSVVVGMACPGRTPASVMTKLVDGLAAEAGRVHAGVVGGDLVHAEKVQVSITALGDLGGRAPVTRTGACAGDVLAVCGRLGWAAAGLAVLGRGFRSPVGVVDAQRYPEPPYAAGPAAAAAGATSMIDISDGLLADLGHIARGSGVVLDVGTNRLTVPERLVDVAAALGADPLDWVLTGGEDHALAATFPPTATLPEGWVRIGTVTDGEARVTVDNKPYERKIGWEHWR